MPDPEYDERDHARRLHALSTRYEKANANRICLRICGGIEQFMTLVACTIFINSHTINGPGSHPLFECWTEWPPIGLTRYPLIVHELSASAGGRNITRMVNFSSDMGITRFYLNSKGQKPIALPIEITFNTPNVFYSLAGLRPFAHKLLSFNIELQQPAVSNKPRLFAIIEAKR